MYSNVTIPHIRTYVTPKGHRYRASTLRHSVRAKVFYFPTGSRKESRNFDDLSHSWWWQVCVRTLFDECTSEKYTFYVCSLSFLRPVSVEPPPVAAFGPDPARGSLVHPAVAVHPPPFLSVDSISAKRKIDTLLKEKISISFLLSEIELGIEIRGELRLLKKIAKVWAPFNR